MSEINAWKARRAFVTNVACGDSGKAFRRTASTFTACMVSLHAHMLESFACAGMNLAEAALQVAAEDDALVSHSSVQLPVQSFLNRISRLANDVNTLHLRSLPPGSSPQEALQVSPSQSQKRLSCSRKAHLLQGTPVLPRCFCQVDVSSHERWHKRII